MDETLYYCACQGGYVSSAKECSCAQRDTPPDKRLDEWSGGPETTGGPIATSPVTTVYGQPMVVPSKASNAPRQTGSALPWIVGGAVLLWLMSK